MTNIINFPGVCEASNDHTKYCITSEEILAFVTTHLARQICEPTTPDAMVSVGVSDEGDGWLYCQREIHRTGWSDTTPFCRFEKDSNGVRGTFFQKVAVNGVEVRSSKIAAKTLNDLLDKRMRKSQISIQRMLQQLHLPIASEIASEIRNSFLPTLSVNRYAPDVLQSIDYDAVERMYIMFDEAAATAVQDIKFDGTLDG